MAAGLNDVGDSLGSRKHSLMNAVSCGDYHHFWDQAQGRANELVGGGVDKQLSYATHRQVCGEFRIDDLMPFGSKTTEEWFSDMILWTGPS